ncbi:hypothetical protein ACNGTO_03040 [Bisgaard Taxon 45]
MVRTYFDETVCAIKRARKPLLQLSSGRDSLCALLALIEAGCTGFDVAWVDTSDTDVDTFMRMLDLKFILGDRLHYIKSDSIGIRETYGIPSPMIRPQEANPLYGASADDTRHVQMQMDCCARTIMIPLHEFTVNGGYDLVIRGCRADENLKTPVEHLTNSDTPYILAYPIYDWSAKRVNEFLIERNALPSFYEFMNSGVDCVTCPAFWGNGHQAWLEHHYPDKAETRKHQIEKLMDYMSHTIQLGFNEIDKRSVA